MRVIVFAPHNDDEVLGVGGTIAKMTRQGHEVYICEATTPADIPDLAVTIKEEALEAHRVLGIKDTIFLDLPVVALKDTPTKIVNACFEKVVSEIKPEIAFIPHKGDMHIDHGEVAKAAMVALRPISNPQLKMIFSYETLSESEWNIPSVDNAFCPTFYSDITETIDTKIKAMQCYQSQLMDSPHPRSINAIDALARYRGSTVGKNYAEAFVLVRGSF